MFVRLLSLQWRLQCVRALALCALVGASGGHAQTMGAVAPAELQRIAQVWLRDSMAAARPAGADGLRMEFAVGEVDGRLKLAACTHVEAYLPPGTRLWGKTRVGLRCTDGSARWNISVPATVSAFGPAWVVKGQIASGVALTADDVTQMEVNWAEDPSPVLRDRPHWEGQVAARFLSTGQTLRQGMVKPAQVFMAGAQVRVVAQGAGFQVSSDATALSAGVVGQSAQVRMDNGRIATGVVLDMRTVRIDL